MEDKIIITNFRKKFQRIKKILEKVTKIYWIGVKLFERPFYRLNMFWQKKKKRKTILFSQSNLGLEPKAMV